MKQLFLLMAVGFFPAYVAAEILPLAPDTIIILNNGKRLEVEETPDRIKVKVYEPCVGNNENSEMVFEGHYKNGKSYERRSYISVLKIPVPKWYKDDYEPHWSGFSMGFNNFADGSFRVNDISGVHLNSARSLEYNLNVFEKAFPFSRHGWAIVTGIGMRWNRYYLDDNAYFQEVDGVTALHPAPQGVRYLYSKLGTTSITVPALLEWQQVRRNGKSGIFVSAGVVGVLKTASSSRVKYVNENGKTRKEKMDTGMNIRPVMVDFLVQAGWGAFGIYGKYSPMNLFERNRGPKVQPVSIGFQLHI